MLGSRLLAVGLFLVSTLGSPSLVEQRGLPVIIGHMTLLWTNRLCDGSECMYDFAIDENDGSLPTRCGFLVSGEASGTQGNQTSFRGLDCDDENDNFRINGYWDESGLTTIVVMDIWINGVAAFVFDDNELLGDGTESRGSPIFDARTINLTDDDDWNSRSGRLRIRDDTQAEQDDFWQIQGMNRDYRAASHLTYLDFTIVLTDGKRENCHLIVPDTNPDSSFWAVPCGVSGYTVSWGYKADTDGGVMTVCNPEMHKNAWFGWDGISRRSYLGDSPRNFARPVDCE